MISYLAIAYQLYTIAHRHGRGIKMQKISEATQIAIDRAIILQR